MESRRQKKIANILKQDLASIFQQESKVLFGGAFITVTHVRVTSDLSFAKVYLSILGNDAESTLLLVKSQSKEIRYSIAQKVKNQMRKVPDFQFYIDDSLDYYENIDRLLKE
ncbi:MAG: ribosome-binding factor A [Flavobacteriales bacterium]|jgi:ribosome-binding factor A|nr:ribosome-binding factor A [Flavobacteriales bacterium]|tara:strand:+ start:6575 stop:6910 length:336 start_codon:yes stop_codon:yes gene_type:complete